MPKKALFDQMPLGRHLSVLTKMYYGALSKRLEHLDLERYYSILILIESSEEKCTQQFISDTLRIDKASMVRIIDFLVKKKFLKRTANPKDRREYHMELTAKAVKIMPELHLQKNELNSIALKGLSKTEIELFYKTLSLICCNLSQQPADRIIVNYKKVKPLKNEEQ